VWKKAQKTMIKISLTISDEQGILKTIEQAFTNAVLLANFTSIEAGIGSFIGIALPQASSVFLEKAQENHSLQTVKKKTVPAK
jgi:hypothetical protein